jgi:hypothetical protein
MEQVVQVLMEQAVLAREAVSVELVELAVRLAPVEMAVMVVKVVRAKAIIA